MEDLIKIAIDNIKEGNYVLIAMVLLVYISLWLYNEFRKSYINTKSENKVDVEKALEQYSKLYFGIISFQLQKINTNELFEHINLTIAYLPRKITKKISELDKDSLGIDSSKLEEIKQDIKNEISSIKLKQYTITTFDYNENIFNRVSWFLSMSNFDSFVQPFIYFVFALTGIMFLLSIVITIDNLSGFSQIIVTIFLINIMFSIFILIHLLDLTFNKNANTEFWKYFLLLILLPIFLATLLVKYSIINAILIIINAISITIFFYMSNRKNLLRPNKE